EGHQSDAWRGDVLAATVSLRGQLPLNGIAGRGCVAVARSGGSPVGCAAVCLFRPAPVAQLRGQAVRGGCAGREHSPGRPLPDPVLAPAPSTLAVSSAGAGADLPLLSRCISVRRHSARTLAARLAGEISGDPAWL